MFSMQDTGTQSLALQMRVSHIRYLPHRYPNKGLKGIVVNRTCLVKNGFFMIETLTITLIVSLIHIYRYM